LFLAGTNGNLTVKALSPLFAVLLAITGALAAMCFVKAYGVAFAGPSRSDRAREATEVPGPMRLGMAVLVAGCLVLGLGAPVVVPYLGHVASALLGVPPVPVRSGLQVFPADGAHATLSTPLLFLFLVGMLTVPLLLVWVHGGLKAGRRVVAEPWACGYAYSSRMAYTATAFAQPLRVLFRPLYKLRTALANLAVRMAAYSHQAAGFIDRADSMWEHGIYGPLARGTLALGKRVQRIQQGNVRLYCLYLLITLVVLLVTTVG
ncbi:MAG: hydrogenase 4 subunit B, partial [Calditerricola sp.]|nr:hydrogenase 4 subunit B [Calditerricola sp.]